MMAQYIKQANIFGRIGSGLGKGIGEQLPKEIERSRLASGLQNLSQQKGLTPFQQFAGLAATPGITPQMIQSGTDLLRQQARGQSLSKFNGEQNATKPFPLPNGVSSKKLQTTPENPSLTKEEPFARAQEGFIPRSEDEKMQSAGERYNADPALFGNDPQKAIDYENKVDATNQAIANANQTKHQNLSAIQDNVVNRLKQHATNLGAIGENGRVPADIYSDIEDKAIQATKPRSEGGGGLTEQEAMKKYGKELDTISRQYSDLNSIGNWGITGRKASETLRNLDRLQGEFEKRNDTRNLALKLIGDSKLSPPLAYSIAEPVKKIPHLNKEIKSLPTLQREETLFETVRDPDVIQKTLDASSRLLPMIDGNGSPLAIAYELEKKGYDGTTWLDYVNKNKGKLKNFTALQDDQLSKPLPTGKPWNDWWLEEWSGIE